MKGGDIFCGLTVPVGEGHVTLVLGGWGDNVVGLSSIDGFAACENESTVAMSFENGRWYRVALRVTGARIEARIEGEQVIELDRGDRVFTVYDQLLPTRPCGLFSWRTEGAIRDIELVRVEFPYGDEFAVE